MTVIIDASVFVSASRPEEPNHKESLGFLETLRGLPSVAAHGPTIVLSECAAAIARGTQDEDLARRLVAMIRAFPRIQFTAISVELALGAAEVAIQNRLRAADAVYVAVGALHESVVVTWDREILTRHGAVVQAMTPAQWLASQPTEPQS